MCGRHCVLSPEGQTVVTSSSVCVGFDWKSKYNNERSVTEPPPKAAGVSGRWPSERSDSDRAALSLEHAA